MYRFSIPLLMALSACSSQTIEPAPIKGGETLSYNLENSPVTLTLEKSGEGFVIRTNASYPPQNVAANLRDGRKPVLALDIGLLWLEPAQRRVGGKTHFGDVIAEEPRLNRPALKMSERNGHVEYWFSKATGFLLERRVNPSGPTVKLTSSTIPGL